MDERPAAFESRLDVQSRLRSRRARRHAKSGYQRLSAHQRRHPPLLFEVGAARRRSQSRHRLALARMERVRSYAERPRRVAPQRMVGLHGGDARLVRTPESARLSSSYVARARDGPICTAKTRHSHVVTHEEVFAMRGLAGALAAIVLLAQSPGSAAQLTWHETASMGWTHSALVAVHSGPNIYLIGDRDNLHIYNIANNSWSKGTAPPLNQYGPAVALNGKIYVIGGVTGPKITGNVIAYDPATDKWSNAASLPSPHGAAAAAVLGGKIHLVGGRAYQGATLVDVNDHLVYDPAANAWSKSTPMPTSRDSLSLVADPSS